MSGTLDRRTSFKDLRGAAPWVLVAIGALSGLGSTDTRAPPTLGPVLGPSIAPPPGAPESYALAQGVIVEPQRHRFYLTSADGGVEAVDFVRGGVVWASPVSQAPILVRRDRLLALGRTTQRSGLRLLLLDVSSGRVVDSLHRASLWSEVVPSVGMQAQAWFGIEGSGRGDTAFVTCTWASRIPPGRAPPARRPIPPLGPRWQARTWWDSPQRIATIVVDLRSHVVTVRDSVPGRYPLFAGQPSGPYDLGPFLVSRDTLVVSKRPTPGGSQIILRRTGTRGRTTVLATEGVDGVRDVEAEVSADGRHLVLERMMGQREGYRPRFTVFAMDPAQRLGEVEVQELRSAFLVLDGRFVYANGFQAEAQVLDLKTGRILFRRPVRTLRYVPFSGPCCPA